MRLRIRELLDERQWTPLDLTRRSAGRISQRAAYRYMELDGHLTCYDDGLLEALCDIFAVEPGDLFTRDKGRARTAKKSKGKRS